MGRRSNAHLAQLENLARAILPAPPRAIPPPSAPDTQNAAAAQVQEEESDLDKDFEHENKVTDLGVDDVSLVGSVELLELEDKDLHTRSDVESFAQKMQESFRTWEKI